jgi:hypothetical protein
VVGKYFLSPGNFTGVWLIKQWYTPEKMPLNRSQFTGVGLIKQWYTPEKTPLNKSQFTGIELKMLPRPLEISQGSV